MRSSTISTAAIRWHESQCAARNGALAVDGGAARRPCGLPVRESFDSGSQPPALESAARNKRQQVSATGTPTTRQALIRTVRSTFFLSLPKHYPPVRRNNSRHTSGRHRLQRSYHHHQVRTVSNSYRFPPAHLPVCGALDGLETRCPRFPSEAWMHKAGNCSDNADRHPSGTAALIWVEQAHRSMLCKRRSNFRPHSSRDLHLND